MQVRAAFANAFGRDDVLGAMDENEPDGDEPDDDDADADGAEDGDLGDLGLDKLKL